MANFHVAVGDYFDGSDWVSRSTTSPPDSTASPWTTTVLDNSTYGFWDVAYGNEKWIAITDERSLWYSTDGTNWTQVVNAFPANYYASHVAASSSLYIAYGADGVYYSTDAVTWSQGRAYDSDDLINGIYWDGTQFILHGSHRVTLTDTRPFLSTSANGTSWTDYVGPTGTAGYRSFDSIAFDGVTWVANVSTSTTVRQIGTATSLSSWTISSFTTSGSLLAVAYGNGYFAFGHTNGNVYYSTTATGWSTSNAVAVVRGDIIEYSGAWLLSNEQSVYATGSDPTTGWSQVYDGSALSADIYALASGAASVSHNFSVNAVLQRTKTASATADAVVSKTRFPADAVIFRSGISFSFTSNAYFAYFRSQDLDPDLGLRRNRHDRNDAHFGMTSAADVAHDQVTLIEDILRDLWDRISTYEDTS